MAATNYTPISLYYSSTATNVPLAANLVAGELAINTNDGKLFYKDSSGVVQVLASKAGNVNVSSFSAGTTGFTPNTATTGAVTLAGTLATTNGGTGLTSFTANGVVYASSTSALATGSALTFDGTNFANTLSTNASAGIRVTNSNAGASTSTNTSYSNGTNAHEFGILGTGYTTYGVLAAGDAYIYAGASKNIALSADGGAIKFGAGSGGSEQMRLTSTGLGIGTSSPAYKLDVQSGSSPTIRVRNTANATSNYSQLLLETSNSFSGLGDAYLRAISMNSGNSSTSLAFGVNADGGGAPYEAMRLDSSGNLGLSVTPSAWYSAMKAIQVNTTTSVASFSSGANQQAWFSSNSYLNASGVDTYITSNYASSFRIDNGSYKWYNAPSGTAGNAITFTQAMTLDASGNLGVGSTNPSVTGYGKAVRLQGSGNAAYEVTDGTVTTVMLSTAGSLGIVRTDSNHPLVFGTNGTERARIDSSGNLLVGQTSATGKLSVTDTGSGNTGIFAINATDNVSTFVWAQQAFLAGQTAGQNFVNFIGKAGSVLNAGYIGYKYSSAGSTSNFLTFGHYGADNLMNLDGSGNLLVGTTTSGGAGGMSVLPLGGGAGTAAIQIFNKTNTASDSAILFRVSGTTVSGISYTSTVVTYGTVSDYRLKTVIGAVTDSGNRIDALEPIEYTWNSNGSRTRGFLAHKFQEIYADSVTGTKDAVDADGKPMYQGMQAGTTEVIADLVAEIQSLRKRLTALESKA